MCEKERVFSRNFGLHFLWKIGKKIVCEKKKPFPKKMGFSFFEKEKMCFYEGKRMLMRQNFWVNEDYFWEKNFWVSTIESWARQKNNWGLNSSKIDWAWV